ncbi:hypothetical protein JCM10213_007899 [Rhodosporidiobolus nylandii]
MSNDHRIDWHSMMVNDGDEIKEADGRTTLHPSDVPVDHGLSEVSAGVLFDYDEPSELHKEHLTDSVWHNAMLHVDGEHDAIETYHSLPHWTWVDDE